MTESMPDAWHAERLLKQTVRTMEEVRILRTMCRDVAAEGHELPEDMIRNISQRFALIGRELLAGWKHVESMSGEANAGLRAQAAAVHDADRKASRELLFNAVDRLSANRR